MHRSLYDRQLLMLCMAMAGWTIYFGAYTETVFGTSATPLSILFLIISVSDMTGYGLMPILLHRSSACKIYVAMTALVACSVLLVSLLSGSWWLVTPFAVTVGLGTTSLYLTSSTLLLEEHALGAW